MCFFMIREHSSTQIRVKIHKEGHLLQRRRENIFIAAIHLQHSPMGSTPPITSPAISHLSQALPMKTANRGSFHSSCMNNQQIQAAKPNPRRD